MSGICGREVEGWVKGGRERGRGGAGAGARVGGKGEGTFGRLWRDCGGVGVVRYGCFDIMGKWVLCLDRVMRILLLGDWNWELGIGIY